MYNSIQYCDTNLRLHKEKLTVGGSLKQLRSDSISAAGNGFVMIISKSATTIFGPVYNYFVQPGNYTCIIQCSNACVL